jgi:GH18 family chitinase
MDWKVVQGQVDYISLMTYDFCGSQSAYPCHHADLRTVDHTVRRLHERYELDPAKSLLGLPFFGKLFYARDWADALPQSGARMVNLDYADALSLANGREYVESWDTSAQAPFLRKKSPGGGLVTYDTPKSTGMKCRYAADKGFAGVLVWRLGYDLVGDHTPLLDAVAESFGSMGQSVPTEALARMDQALADEARASFDQLSRLSRRLSDNLQLEEAAAAAPLPLPDLTVPEGRRKLVAHLKQLQAFLADAHLKIQCADQLLGLPLN